MPPCAIRTRNPSKKPSAADPRFRPFFVVACFSFVLSFFYPLCPLSSVSVIPLRHTRNRKTSMPPAGFEPAIPASNRPQTLALDRWTTGIGMKSCLGGANLPQLRETVVRVTKPERAEELETTGKEPHRRIDKIEQNVAGAKKLLVYTIKRKCPNLVSERFLYCLIMSKHTTYFNYVSVGNCLMYYSVFFGRGGGVVK